MLSATKIWVFVLAVAAIALVESRAEVQTPDTVVVPSGQLALQALLWRPVGRGPFPAVLFNHGSWPTNNGPRRAAQEIYAQAATLGPVFARHGFAFLFLFRRGVGLSAGQGANAGDLLDEELAKNGREARNQVRLRLLETDELNDAVAGLTYLRALPEVDSRRVAVAGHSFGGALTLLLAEKDRGLVAAVDFGGAAGGWESSPPLRARLLAAVGVTTVPVFFIHAANDYSTAPGLALAAEMARLGKPNRIRIYPAFGTTPSQGHNFVDLNVAAWEHDVFAFLDECLRR